MKAFAPGKLVLTGAYAVLEGAPAIVVGTSRGAYADAAATGPTSIEVRAAIGDEPAPLVDTSELYVDGRKLGLGASSAALVASLAARAVKRGVDVRSPDARASLFQEARRAHAEAQGGGSGVDVAASVYGGTLRYTMGQLPEPTALPDGLRLAVFACRNSARTSELRARVDALRATKPDAHRRCLDALSEIALAAVRAAEANDAPAFVARVSRAAETLAELGALADAPIVPAEVAELTKLATQAHAAFCVSGAGGGDVAFFVGPQGPSADFTARADALGLSLLDVDVDVKGVRPVTEPKAIGQASSWTKTP